MENFLNNVGYWIGDAAPCPKLILIAKKFFFVLVCLSFGKHIRFK